MMAMFSKPRVLADHRRQLEAVEFRHADIDQDDGDLGLQQLFQSLPGRTGLDQVLSQLPRMTS